jgi:hypothetical protein
MQSYSLPIPAEKQAFHFIFILVEGEDLLLYYSDTCIEQSKGLPRKLKHQSW